MPTSNERPSRKRQTAPTSPEVVRGLPEACSPKTSATGRTTHEYGPSRMAPRKRSGSCSRVHASAALRCTDICSVRWDTMPATESPLPSRPFTDGGTPPYSVATLEPGASCSVPCRSTCLMKTPLSTIALRGSPGSRSSATSRCPWITNSRSPAKPKLPITAGATAILFEPSRRRPTGPSSSSNSPCLATSASVESYGRRASAGSDRGKRHNTRKAARMTVRLGLRQGKCDQARDGRRRDDHRFGQLPYLPEQQDRDQQHGERRNIGDGALAEHDDRAGDGAHRGRGDTVDESDDPRPFSVLVEVRRRNDGEQVAGQKGGKRGHGCTRKPGDEITDEAHRDDHGPRRDHRHRHRVDELALVQPVVLVHHASVEERHDRKAAAEHEGPGFAEEQSDLQEERPVDDRGHAGRGRELGRHGEHGPGLEAAFGRRFHEPRD